MRTIIGWVLVILVVGWLLVPGNFHKVQRLFDKVVNSASSAVQNSAPRTGLIVRG